MERSMRERIVHIYFDAMDRADPDIVRSDLSDSFTYTAGDGTTFEGRDSIARYISEVRSLSETDHRIDHLLHGDGVAVAEGRVSGTGPDGATVEVGFSDLFVFDGEELGGITVYINEL